MKINIDKEFEVNAKKDLVWELLTDVYKVVTCLPGALIEEQLSENVYKGKMGIKVGPLNLNFGGEATITEMKQEEGKFCLKGKGSDKTGKGMANMTMQIILIGDGDTSKVKLDTELSISGKLAQFGSRIIDAATNSIFRKFVENFQYMVANPDAETLPGKPVSAVGLMKDSITHMFKK